MEDIIMQAKGILYEAMLYANEGENPEKAIDDYNAREQQYTIICSQLPIRTNGGFPDEWRFRGMTNDMPYEQRREISAKNNKEFTKQQYEKMGITILKEYDDLLYVVQLPEGWKMSSDELYWTTVFDDKGRKRIVYFYKAVFCDRAAFTNFSCRYGFKICPFDDYESDASYEDRMFKPWSVYVTDNGEKIKLLKTITPTTDKEFYRVDDILKKIGIEYMDMNYPNWMDINAYWNEV